MRTLLTETLSSTDAPQKGQSPFPIGFVKRFRLCFTIVPSPSQTQSSSCVKDMKLFFMSAEGERTLNVKAKRRARVTRGPCSNGSWRDKLHPIFLKGAELNRRVVALSRSELPEERREAARIAAEESPRLLKEADALYKSMHKQLRHNALMEALGVEDLPPGTEIPQWEFILRFVCWFRYRKTINLLTSEYQAGDPKAVRQVNELRLELDLWNIGEVDPNRLKFKTDIDHFTLLTGGLDLGLEKLTGEELADFFNEFCPCGKEHFPDNLTKLRARIIKEFPPEDTES